MELTNGWAGAQRPPGQPVPDFTLRDQDGKTVTAASLRGRPVVFAFIYSTCRDTCPAQVQTIRGALDDLPGQGPARDRASRSTRPTTPASARTSFLLKQQMTGRMQFLLGSREQLAAGLGRVRHPAAGRQTLEHSAHTVLADAQGFQRIGFPFDHLTEEALAHDLARLSR